MSLELQLETGGSPPVEAGMDHDTAMFIAVVVVLMLYILTGAEIILAAITALGLLYIVPVVQLRRMLGYVLLVDISFSYWLIGVAAATFGGFTIATMAGLLYSVASRECLLWLGSERLALGGEVLFGKQLAVLSTQLIAWARALWAGASSGHVEAPVGLTWAWAQVQAPGGFKATRTYRAIQAIKRMLLGRFWAVH